MGVNLTNEMIAGAQATEKKYGVPASITLGQIMLESGGSYEGGLSGLAVKGKNLFGIKGQGTAGTIAMSTMEQGKNGLYATTANFAKYNNFQESIEAHGKLLTNARYTAQTKDAKTVEEYARAIHRAGYATDKNYSDKLINIINKNNLKQYDGGTIRPTQDYTGEFVGVTSSGSSGGSTTNPTFTAEDLQAGYTATGNEDLDLLGQVARFVLIVGLIILAIVFFFSSFGVSVPSVPIKGVKANNE